ncbi:hypothetical protein BV898_01343 [Hypsibius exemplaris]|uniref:Prefoldin subunit 1 n=1 Tax=Hypsibius exemplaris TaxID=2072580 RepID=A0A1W0XBW1_HYPEX|nr:hypothetical protein BV898_01343 [Hypsibius exemplaris]
MEAADPELTKAFQQLQSKKQETAQQVELMDNKIGGTARAVKISELTLAEVSDQPIDAHLYRCIGRAFFLSSKTGIQDFFQTKVSKLNENIRAYQESKAVLQKELKESEQAIRELVMRKKQQMSSLSSSGSTGTAGNWDKPD